MRLGSAQHDRAVGAMVGSAVGDALGAPYEFHTPGPKDPVMKGGGSFGWEPGEWTDDSSMMVGIAQVLEHGETGVESIGERFIEWYRSSPPDVGNLTADVLSTAKGAGELPSIARRVHEQAPDSTAGNGSLMRTAPVANAFLDGNDEDLIQVAKNISAITHADPSCQEACALWCVGLRHAVLHGTFDGVRVGADLLRSESVEKWHDRLDEAESQPPAAFTGNGYVVRALQAAWSAITHIGVPGSPFQCVHFQSALKSAIAIGDDTDTVGAITGAMLGARWGASAIPTFWTEKLHGWPGWDHPRLIRSSQLIARGGVDDEQGWPSCPSMIDHYSTYWNATSKYGTLARDPAVALGDALALRNEDFQADVVVSLCRMGSEDVADTLYVPVHLIDVGDPDENPNLAFLIKHLAESIVRWRSEDKSVFIHCVGAMSRTPTIGAAYLCERFKLSTKDALSEVRDVLPEMSPNQKFFEELTGLYG